MAERNWPRTISEILSSEGGYVNNPKDPGGPTNLGVTLANFRRFVKPDGTIDDLKALTKAQAATVFRRQYWDEVLGSALPDGVDYCVTDFAVNSGPGRAARAAQTIAGAKVDGQIGPDSLTAIEKITEAVFINQYCDARLVFLKGLSTWGTFGNGWTTRVEKVRKISLSMITQAPEVTKVQVVEKPVETPVAVVAKGSDKRSWLWGGLSTISLSTVVSGFADVPWQYKVGAGVIALATVVIMLFLGDRIIRRVKSLRDEINAPN